MRNSNRDIKELATSFFGELDWGYEVYMNDAERMGGMSVIQVQQEVDEGEKGSREEFRRFVLAVADLKGGSAP